jgi:hypothetical protein
MNTCVIRRILYVIPNWERDFENSKSRQVQHATFFCVPNHFDGKRIRRLQKLDDAAELYGAFIAICAIASKCWYRGVLLDRFDGPLNAEDLSDRTGFSSACFARALTELSKPTIGLLERHDIELNEAGEWPLPAPVKRWAIPQSGRRRAAAEKPRSLVQDNHSAPLSALLSDRFNGSNGSPKNNGRVGQD